MPTEMKRCQSPADGETVRKARTTRTNDARSSTQGKCPARGRTSGRGVAKALDQLAHRSCGGPDVVLPRHQQHRPHQRSQAPGQFRIGLEAPVKPLRRRPVRTSRARRRPATATGRPTARTATAPPASGSAPAPAALRHRRTTQLTASSYQGSRARRASTSSTPRSDGGRRRAGTARPTRGDRSGPGALPRTPGRSRRWRNGRTGPCGPARGGRAALRRLPRAGRRGMYPDPEALDAPVPRLSRRINVR